MSELRGMILAAGYGTRLAPVTDHVPKPLLPVDGVPLLDRIIAGFDRAGVERIGINSHHLGHLVTDHVERRDDARRFTLFPEKEILGTGGALDGARDFLSVAPHFLVHNGDVLCDADLGGLMDDHVRTGAVATLLLVDWPEVNSVVLSADGRIASIAGRPVSAAKGRSLTFTGIGVYSSRILEDIGPGFSSLIDPLVRALESDPASVRGFAPGDFRWSDLGTLARYLAAQSDGRHPEGSAPTEGAPFLERITGHGSDRRFWRLDTGDWSAVAMVTPPEDEEFDRFVAIARFLADHALGAPAILSVAGQEHTVLMDDLGTSSLYSLVRKDGFGTAEVDAAYRRSVDRLADLQAATDRAMTACPAAVDRRLDYDALRWETGYFRDRFLVGHLGCDPADLTPLDDEFHTLAATVASQPRVLIHRDYQSQNILDRKDGAGLVDFQGMRLGPQAYDLASLIYDPYVGMPAAFRAELVARFADRNPAGDSLPIIRARVVAAGLQRVMQALGAYGFLGHVKGKRDFLNHIPAGRAILRGLLGELGSARDETDPGTGNIVSPSLPALADLLDNLA